MRKTQLSILAAELLLSTSCLAKPLNFDGPSKVKRDHDGCIPNYNNLGVITPYPGGEPITITEQGQAVSTLVPKYVLCEGRDECRTIYSTKNYNWVSTRVPCGAGEFCTVTDMDQPLTIDRQRAYGDMTSLVAPTPGVYNVNGVERMVAQPTTFYYPQSEESYYVVPYKHYPHWLLPQGVGPHGPHGFGKKAGQHVKLMRWKCVGGVCQSIPESWFGYSYTKPYVYDEPWTFERPVYKNGPYSFKNPNGIDITININNAPTTISYSTNIPRTSTRTIVSTRTVSQGSVTTTVTQSATATAVPPITGNFVIAIQVGGLTRRNAKRQNAPSNGYLARSGNFVVITEDPKSALPFAITDDLSLVAGGDFTSASEADLAAGHSRFTLTTGPGFISRAFALGPNNSLQWTNGNFTTPGTIAVPCVETTAGTNGGFGIYFKYLATDTFQCNGVSFVAVNAEEVLGTTTSQSSTQPTTAPTTPPTNSASVNPTNSSSNGGGSGTPSGSGSQSTPPGSTPPGTTPPGTTPPGTTPPGTTPPSSSNPGSVPSNSNPGSVLPTNSSPGDAGSTAPGTPTDSSVPPTSSNDVPSNSNSVNPPSTTDIPTDGGNPTTGTDVGSATDTNIGTGSGTSVNDPTATDTGGVTGPTTAPTDSVTDDPSTISPTFPPGGTETSDPPSFSGSPTFDTGSVNSPTSVPTPVNGGFFIAVSPDLAATKKRMRRQAISAGYVGFLNGQAIIVQDAAQAVSFDVQNQELIRVDVANELTYAAATAVANGVGPWSFKQNSNLVEGDVVDSFSAGNGIIWMNALFDPNTQEAQLCNVGPQLYWKYTFAAGETFSCTDLVASTIMPEPTEVPGPIGGGGIA